MHVTVSRYTNRNIGPLSLNTSPTATTYVKVRLELAVDLFSSFECRWSRSSMLCVASNIVMLMLLQTMPAGEPFAMTQHQQNNQRT